MNFERGQLYHIFNQGNNRQNIFFERDNYLFFLRKMRTYILPYADIIAWCLMPNHFHLMVLVSEVELNVERYARLGVSQRHAESIKEPKLRTFNDSIGIMLMAYTKAINKQQKRSGKLFREQTKAECISCTNGVTPSFYTSEGIIKINTKNPELQYPQICFNYIHQNPVKAGLVQNAVDWEFSSARRKTFKNKAKSFVS
jgi:putative transposase